MKFWVGVTDNRWFEFLRSINPDEINFWQPGGKAPLTQLEPGAPFLFKLKKPHNHIAGGGTFVKSTTLPLSMTWDVFKVKNGAATRTDFERIIRPLISSNERDPEIGCTVLTSPFFWRENQWIAKPEGWARNIVQGKYYDTALPDGFRVWAQVEDRWMTELSTTPPILQETPPRYGNPMLIQPRLGQGAFRVVVTDAYQRRCAITGESTLPVLEAAHIRPFSDEGPHTIQNGLLLRSDFHKLFDIGFVTVTPELNIEVSPKIKEYWYNGKAYYRLHGKPLANLPTDSAFRPNAEYLRWHNENRFQS